MAKKKSKLGAGTSSEGGAVVVSEAAVTEACVAGDLKKLLRYARQGVRVVTGEPLCSSVQGGLIEVVCCVVKELGADVNQTDKRGYTPLGIAAYHGNVEMVRCLVTDLGADVNHADNRESHTPLMTAALRAHTNVLKVLAELGADSNLVEDGGLTASSLAAQDGLLDVVKVLKDLSIDVSQTGADGDAPSHAHTSKG
jgi:hypothetical protein